MPDLRPASQTPRPESIAPVDDPFYAPPANGTDLRDLYDIVLRGKWLLLICVVAAIVPTALWSLAQPSLYSSYSVILVDKEDDNLGGALSATGTKLSGGSDAGAMGTPSGGAGAAAPAGGADAPTPTP